MRDEISKRYACFGKYGGKLSWFWIKVGLLFEDPRYVRPVRASPTLVQLIQKHRSAIRVASLSLSLLNLPIDFWIMDSQEKADAKAAFRKPSSDAGNRKYRRHPSTSPSPPPAGSPEHRADRSHHISRKDSSRISDDGHRRKDDRELDETSGRNGRTGDSHRHGRHSPRRSRDYRRHDDYRDDEDRDHSRLAPRSARDSRDGRHYDHKKNENDYWRSRDGDKYSRPREINDDASYKNKHNEKDGHNETRGSRSIRGENTTGRSSYDDARANHGDSSFASEASGRRTSAARSDDVDIVNYQKSSREDNKRCGSRETKLTRERETRGSREYNVDELGFGSRRPLSPSKKAKLVSPERSGDLKISEKCQGTFSEAATQPFSANDVDAAKVAAIRAAELVNKNLVGVGVAGALSTDQKKKLLWGNKKKAVEESGHIWDASLFPDREQQEKFNRLMGVKGEVKAEQKPVIDAEKQKELQLDLEKQYTAGLRRRDGRTVGLGL